MIPFVQQWNFLSWITCSSHRVHLDAAAKEPGKHSTFAFECVNGVSFVLCLTWKGTFYFHFDFPSGGSMCRGDTASIPDHFQVPSSFVIAFCNRWCHASRTKGGAKKNKQSNYYYCYCYYCCSIERAASPFGDLAIRNRSCCRFLFSLAALSFLPACRFDLLSSMV